jgi:hypothetical protein
MGEEPAAAVPATAAPSGNTPVATRSPSAGGDLAFYHERLILATREREGPLPSGRELRRYREADPSAPRIILDEFRAESLHRRHMEREIVAGENRRADRGQLFALVIILVGLTISALLIQGGHDVAGGFIGGLDLLGIAALFLTGVAALREREPPKKQEKRQAAAG